MKPSPERLTREAYPFQIQLETRFGDIDVLRHLNNVAIVALFQEARVRMYQELRAATPSWTGSLVVANLSIAYVAEGFYPEPVRAGCAILEVGRTSFKVAQALFQQQHCISTAEVVQIYRDDAGPAPVGEEMRANLLAMALMNN